MPINQRCKTVRNLTNGKQNIKQPSKNLNNLIKEKNCNTPVGSLALNQKESTFKNKLLRYHEIGVKVKK